MLNNVQNLRAFAAYAVVFYHCLIRFVTHDSPAASLVDTLSGGVDLFFVISGFVMVHTTKEDESSAWFLTKRVARIVPLYWCATFVAAGLFLFRDWSFPGTVLDAPSILSSLFFIPHPNAAGFLYPVLGVGWTLNYEMTFYVLFALSLLLPERRRLAGVVGLITLVFLGALLSGQDVIRKFYGNPIVFEFAAGCIIAYSMRLKAVAAFARAVPMWPLAVAGAGVILAMALLAPNSWHSLFRIGIPAIALVFAAAAQDLYRKPATNSLLSQLGDASYSAYLLHPIVIVFMILIFDRVLGDGLASDITILLVTPAITAIISIWSLRWFEKPTARLVRNLSHRAGVQPPRSEAPKGLTPQRVP